MEFKYRRKYTSFFILALVLHSIVMAFWLFFPESILKSIKNKQTITLLALTTCELILIFYIGLFRKKYFAYYDKFFIKRSLFKNISIPYSSIVRIKEKNTDTVFLSFGKRPSFKIYYKNTIGRIKKITIRSNNNKLLIKVLKNEIQITNINNYPKKLTK